MIYKKDEVFPGSMLRIDLNGVFEGYATLIEPAGAIFTEMERDHSPVIVSRRWLVEFVPFSEELSLSSSEKITQINVAGVKTHRIIKFVAGNFSKTNKVYNKEEKKIEELPEIFEEDDFSGQF